MLEGPRPRPFKSVLSVTQQLQLVCGITRIWRVFFSCFAVVWRPCVIHESHSAFLIFALGFRRGTTVMQSSETADFSAEQTLLLLQLSTLGPRQSKVSEGDIPSCFRSMSALQHSSLKCVFWSMCHREGFCFHRQLLLTQTRTTGQIRTHLELCRRLHLDQREQPEVEGCVCVVPGASCGAHFLFSSSSRPFL